MMDTNVVAQVQERYLPCPIPVEIGAHHQQQRTAPQGVLPRDQRQDCSPPLSSFKPCNGPVKKTIKVAWCFVKSPHHD